MEWLKALGGTIVGLDTSPLIYLIEEKPSYLKLVRSFFEAMDRGEFQVVTSMITLTEVLVHPRRHGDPDLAERYLHALLHANCLTTVPLSADITQQAAALRAGQHLRTPDAIQLATAIRSGAASFLTNDHRLPAHLRPQDAGLE